MNDKLVKIQSELKAPKGQYNKFGKYNYRSCEDIMEALKPLLAREKLTLILSDEVINVGAHNYVKSTAILDDGEGQVLVSALAREADTQAGMSASQITGSSSSYARKYALNGLFAIDDTKDADTMDNTHATRVVQPTVSKTYIDPVGEAKEQLKDALVEAGHRTPEQKLLVIDKVLGKSTVDSVAEAYEVIQAINDGIA